jgi:hypothetical protein
MVHRLESDPLFNLNSKRRGPSRIVSSQRPLRGTRSTFHRDKIIEREKDDVVTKREIQKDAKPLPQPVKMLKRQEGIHAGIRGDIPERGDEHRNHQQTKANNFALTKRPGYAAGDPRRKSGPGKSHAVQPDVVKPWRNSAPMRTLYSTGGFSFLCCACSGGTQVVGTSACSCSHTMCNTCYSGGSDKVVAKGKNGGKRGKGAGD